MSKIKLRAKALVKHADEFLFVKNFRYFNSSKSEWTAGIDEVAVSPIAGNLIASVVILPENHGIKELPVDSKVLSEESVLSIADKIKEKAIFAKIYYLEPSALELFSEEHCIHALWAACAKSVRGIRESIRIIVDGKREVQGFSNQEAVIAGDSKVDCVSAAAILAKSFEIHQMREFHKLYPQYGFLSHKGYATSQHIKAISEYGLTPIHRKSATEKALQKGLQKEELSLPVAEVSRLLKRAETIVAKFPHLASHWQKEFIEDMNARFFFLGYNLTAREQFFLKKTNKELDITAKKRRKDIKSLSFSVPDREETKAKSPSDFMIIFDEVLPLLKQDITLASDWSLKFLSDQLKNIRTGKELSEKQKNMIVKVRFEILRNASKKGVSIAQNIL